MPKYLSVLEITQAGRMLLPDILSAFAGGSLRAYSARGKVQFLSCHGEFPDWSASGTFNALGEWKPGEEESAEHAESLKWEQYLSRMWNRTIRLQKRIVPAIGALPDDPAFFPMPLDEISAKNMGLDHSRHNELLMALLIPLDDVEALEGVPALLSGREEATYLKIMRGLMLALKIDPASRNATSQVKATLERQGIELDDETIRQRVFKLKGKI